MPNAIENTPLQRDLLAEISAMFGTEKISGAMREPEEVEVTSSHVMVIDDEAINVKLVRKVLQEVGFVQFSDVTDPREALSRIRQASPDVILLDIMMPHINGLEILEAIRATAQLKHVPVLILTASVDRETKLEALELGATDFLTKPVDRAELIPRVRNALKMKACHDHFRNYSTHLEETVRQRTEEVVNSRLQIVHCLAKAAEFHDDVTGRHIIRVGRYAGLIGEELGLSSHEAQLLELAAQLHDVGKIGIPDSILRKEGALTPEEFTIVQEHCVMGKSVFDDQQERQDSVMREHSILGSKLLGTSNSPLLRLAARIALTHHERWDGEGYPIGLSGEDIPLEGRITAVADVFDALSGKRCYKDAYPMDRCFELLEEGRGTQFDPMVLDAFLRRRDDVIDIQLALADLHHPV